MIRHIAAALATVLTVATGARGADFAIDLPSYDETAHPVGYSIYYSDNNLSADGNFLVGQVGYGPREVSVDDGSLVNTFDSLNDTNLLKGAKSALKIGSYIFFAHDDSGGIARLDADTWSNATTAWVNPTNAAGVGASCEALCTDGTLLFGNDDSDRTNIHAWAINNTATNFTATLQWTASIPVGRIRGFSYADGYLYVCGFGATGDRSIYAIKVSDQTVTDTGVDVPGTDTGYGTIRSGALLMAVTVGNVYVWDLTSPTVAVGASMDTYTQAQLTGGANPMYSLSYSARRLLVGWNGKTRVFDAGKPAAVASVLPLFSGELRLARTMTLKTGSAYNPRMYGDDVYAVDGLGASVPPFSVGRFLPGSTTADTANNLVDSQTRMLSPMGGDSTTWVLGSGGSDDGYFKRFDYATMANVVNATNPLAVEPNSFDWVDSDTVICGSYEYRDRLYLMDITADPFSVALNTTWNANGYVVTSSARIRNVAIGDVYSGYAYYADSVVSNPTLYALDLATGGETAIGSVTVTLGYAGVWMCKELNGYLYVMTTTDGIYVYNMTDATTLGTLYTHHTKAEIDAVTGPVTHNYGFDVFNEGRGMLLSAGPGKIAELGPSRALPFAEDFESDYANGDAITSYHGWTASDSSSVATSTAAINGSLGGYVPPGAAVSNEYVVGASDRMWTDLQIRPALWGETTDPAIDSSATALFYVNSNGYPVVCTGPFSWATRTTTPAGGPITPYSTSNVARVTICSDYAERSWALFFDEVLVAQQVGFVDDSVSQYSLFAVKGGDTEFDDLTVTDMYPSSGFTGDQDGDGLLDVWEIHYFNSIAGGATDDPDGDRRDNANEQAAGTDPLDPQSFSPFLSTRFSFR